MEPKEAPPVSRADRAPPSGDHQGLMAAYAGWLGYKIPNGGKEASAAQQLLAAGYTLEQIERAYHALKTQPFYADKHVSLKHVYGQIGALSVKHKPRAGPAPPTNGYHPPPVPEGELATADDWKNMPTLNGIGHAHDDTRTRGSPTPTTQPGGRSRPPGRPPDEP